MDLPSPQPSAPPTVPRWLVAVGGIAWRVLAVLVAVWLLALLVEALTVIVVPILVALLLAGVLEPVVRRAPESWPGWIAPLAAVLVVLAVAAGLAVGLGIRLVDELPRLRDDFESGIAHLEERTGFDLPTIPVPGTSDSGAPATTGDGGGSAPGGDSGVSTDTASQLARVGVEILFGFFLALALAFLFLKDGRSMWAWALDKVGAPIRDDVDASGRAAWHTVGAYVRGLTVVALFDAVGIGLGLLALGVPMVLTLAVLQFVASYVPTLGAFVAGAVAVVVAYGAGGLVTAVLTVALVVVVQQIGNDVIEPWIMGRTIDLHPAMVLVAVSAGAILWGVPGALLFVPLAAALSAAGHVVWVRRQAQDPA